MRLKIPCEPTLDMAEIPVSAGILGFAEVWLDDFASRNRLNSPTFYPY